MQFPRATTAKVGAIVVIVAVWALCGLAGDSVANWGYAVPAVGLLLMGAWGLGHLYAPPRFFFAYGCLGGLGIALIPAKLLSDGALGGLAMILGALMGYVCYRLADFGYAQSSRHRQSGHRMHQCDKCSYNLTGNTSGTCPECGQPIGKPD